MYYMYIIRATNIYNKTKFLLKRGKRREKRKEKKYKI